MDNGILKNKYSVVIDKLEIINAKISALEKDIYLLKNKLNNSLLIDNACLKEETLNNIGNSLNEISLNIKNNIVSNLKQ